MVCDWREGNVVPHAAMVLAQDPDVTENAIHGGVGHLVEHEISGLRNDGVTVRSSFCSRKKW